MFNIPKYRNDETIEVFLSSKWVRAVVVDTKPLSIGRWFDLVRKVGWHGELPGDKTHLIAVNKEFQESDGEADTYRYWAGDKHIRKLQM